MKKRAAAVNAVVSLAFGSARPGWKRFFVELTAWSYFLLPGEKEQRSTFVKPPLAMADKFLFRLASE
jgi:hypothetical protein